MANGTARLKQLLSLVTSEWKIENGTVKDASGSWVLQLYGSPGMSAEEHRERLELVAGAINALATLLEENETSTGISSAIEKVVTNVVSGVMEEKLKEHMNKMHVPWGSD